MKLKKKKIKRIVEDTKPIEVIKPIDEPVKNEVDINEINELKLQKVAELYNQTKAVEFHIDDPKEIEEIKASLNSSNQELKVIERTDYTSIVLERMLIIEQRNIYCGELRRIGKSTALLNVIKSFTKTSSDRIVVIVPFLSDCEGCSFYSDLRKFVDDITTPEDFNQCMSRMFETKPKNVYLFSDEIPHIEQFLTGWSIKYLGGFYSKSLDAKQKFALTRTTIEA